MTILILITIALLVFVAAISLTKKQIRKTAQTVA
jgi:hypothetical protein